MSLFIKTRRYGPLREPISRSCGGLWSLVEAFWPFGQKRSYYVVRSYLVVTLVPFSRNLNNFEDFFFFKSQKLQKIPKNLKIFKKNLKNQNKQKKFKKNLKTP